MPKKKIKALSPGAVIACYIRKSEVTYPPDCITAEARAEFEARQKRLRVAAQREVAARDGREIERVYEDWDISGRAEYVESRGGFGDLTADIRAGLVAHLYVESLSRLMRNALLSLQFIEMARSCSCTIHAPDASFADTPEANLQRGVMASVHQYEAEITGKRIASRNRQAVADGQWVGRIRHSLGLRYSKDTKGFVLDEATAPAARRLFEAFVETGGNLHATVRLLVAEGVPTLRGGVWRAGTVRVSIAAPCYRRKALYKGREYDMSNLIPEVVPTALVGAADALIEQRFHQAREVQGKRHVGARRFALSGLLTCGHCGAAMTGHQTPRGAQPVHYRCLQEIHDGETGHRWAAAQSRIAPVVGRALALALDKYERDEMLPQPKTAATHAPDKGDIERALSALAAQRMSYIRLHVERGVMTEEELTAVLEENDQRRKALESRRIAEESPRPRVRYTPEQWRAFRASVESAVTDHARNDPSVLRGLLERIGAQFTISLHERDLWWNRPDNRTPVRGLLTLSATFAALGIDAAEAIIVAEPRPGKRRLCKMPRA